MQKIGGKVSVFLQRRFLLSALGREVLQEDGVCREQVRKGHGADPFGGKLMGKNGLPNHLAAANWEISKSISFRQQRIRKDTYLNPFGISFFLRLFCRTEKLSDRALWAKKRSSISHRTPLEIKYYIILLLQFFVSGRSPCPSFVIKGMVGVGNPLKHKSPKTESVFGEIMVATCYVVSDSFSFT